jgi:hypothetical protein
MNRRTDPSNRRTNERLELRLLCRLGSDKVLSALGTPGQSLGRTENLSRSGLLLHWLPAISLPELGSSLTVDIELPGDSAFGPRLMRCRTTVVRILRETPELPRVGLTIRNIRFVTPEPTHVFELASMAPASPRLN